MTRPTVIRSQGRILVIDDDENIVAGLKELLNDQGYEVEVGTSPLSVAFKTRRFDPDVVFLDLSMPGLSGSGLLRLGRSRIFATNCQIILFSGRDRQELAALAAELSADGFYSKQEDLDQLLARIPRWVRCRRSSDEYITANRRPTCV